MYFQKHFYIISTLKDVSESVAHVLPGRDDAGQLMRV